MKNCKGCCIRKECLYIKHSKVCPCAICLIKMVCDASCNLHIDFQIQVEQQGCSV
jgi:hypothetical protein